MTVHRDETIRNHTAFIRSVADLQRGDSGEPLAVGGSTTAAVESGVTGKGSLPQHMISVMFHSDRGGGYVSHGNGLRVPDRRRYWLRAKATPRHGLGSGEPSGRHLRSCVSKGRSAVCVT